MNTVVLLLMTTCASADPAMGPQVHSTPSTAGCGCSTGAHESHIQESRPGFFGRIRGLFGRKSHGSEYPTSAMAPSSHEVMAPQHTGAMKLAPQAAPVVSAEPPLDLSIAPPADSLSANRLPGGPGLK